MILFEDAKVGGILGLAIPTDMIGVHVANFQRGDRKVQ
jgi:hypothetical protein